MDKIKRLLQSNTHLKMISLGSIILGCILCVIGFSLVDYDLYKLNPNPIELVGKEKTIPLDNTESIYVDVSHTDISIESIDGNEVQLQYKENEDRPIDIYTENQSLRIQDTNNFKFFQFNWMNINDIDKPSIKLQIPKDYNGNLIVETTYGSININDIKGIKDFSIDNNHGAMDVKNIEASKISLNNTYGLINASNVKSLEAFSVENDHDGINVKNIEASNISLSNKYGNIMSNHLLSQNDIIVDNQHDDTNLNDTTAKNFNGDMSYSYVQIDTMKLEGEFRIDNDHDDVDLMNIESKNSHMEVTYGNLTFKDWICDDILIDAEHGNVIGDIKGIEGDYHTIGNVDHGDSNLAKERNAGKAKILDVTLSYGDLEVNFSE